MTSFLLENTEALDRIIAAGWMEKVCTTSSETQEALVPPASFIKREQTHSSKQTQGLGQSFNHQQITISIKGV